MCSRFMHQHRFNWIASHSLLLSRHGALTSRCAAAHELLVRHAHNQPVHVIPRRHLLRKHHAVHLSTPFNCYKTSECTTFCFSTRIREQINSNNKQECSLHPLEAPIKSTQAHRLSLQLTSTLLKRFFKCDSRYGNDKSVHQLTATACNAISSRGSASLHVSSLLRHAQPTAAASQLSAVDPLAVPNPAAPPTFSSPSFLPMNSNSSSTSSSHPPPSSKDPPVVAPSSFLSSMSLDSQNRTLRYAFLGNVSITSLKLLVFLLTSSQAMFAEFIHTFVDSVNQGFLLLGAREALKRPDHMHQYGRGRAVYVWSLVSALNIFWIGVAFNTYHTLIHASTDLQPHWYTWAVLAFSFCIDGAVLRVALQELNRNRPPDKSMWRHFKNLKNPLIIGTILEDVAAVTGVAIAATGICLSSLTGHHVYDHAASLSVSALLLYISYTLIRTNYAYLLGFSLSPTVQSSITNMIAKRPSIQSVYSVRGEWITSDQFAFRCEIDFDGSYFSAMLEANYREAFREAVERDKREDEEWQWALLGKSSLAMPRSSEVMPKIQGEAQYRFAPQFLAPHTDEEREPARHLSRLLALFAEDVTRLVEEEVVSIESEIRVSFPQAAFIELEPASDKGFQGAVANTMFFNRRNLQNANKEK